MKEAGRERYHILIRGIVQGVGFRPFMHQLAEQYGLTGWIRNTSQGVEMELEGLSGTLAGFPELVRRQAPPMAVIEEIRTERLPVLSHDRTFRILESAAPSLRRTLISPDIGICDACRRELFSRGDRRRRYPFINCTDCGPRFTIVRDIPYDRKNTAMAAFPMCPACAAEYADIRSRRYHAQPDCCPDCGPALTFLDAQGREEKGDPLRAAAELLLRGGILAVKGLGGFHLACRPDSAEGAARIRAVKGRDERPLALMCRDMETVKRLCEVSAEERTLLESPQKPIVLLRKKSTFPYPSVSDNRSAGIMLPYTPLHCLLLAEGTDTLIMTSANLSGLPILCGNEETVRTFAGAVDGFLVHNRGIEAPCDDSVVRAAGRGTLLIRRSRGYVPAPVKIACEGRAVLALGAEQKASFCFLQDGHAFPGQHIGDLKNLETLDVYEGQIARLGHLLDLRPELLACDRHPDYLSTGYAREKAAREGLPLVQVQHHHAHMASCMADNGLEDPCIGIIWDGTGLGMDGTIWGGEFLTGDCTSFARAGTIRPIALPGGDRAVLQPWRTGVSLLLDAGVDPARLFDSPAVPDLCRMIRENVNCPLSSGMGRLFDGAAAICGLLRNAAYEGQGAVLLENAAEEEAAGEYPVLLDKQRDCLCFDWRDMIRAMAEDCLRGVPACQVTAGFLHTLIRMAVRMCLAIREETGLRSVVLSGGTFQNVYLLSRLPGALEEQGFSVYCHRQVSPNDEGLSLGQAVIAGRGGERYVSGSSLAD